MISSHSSRSERLAHPVLENDNALRHEDLGSLRGSGLLDEGSVDPYDLGREVVESANVGIAHLAIHSGQPGQLLLSLTESARA